MADFIFETPTPGNEYFTVEGTAVFCDPEGINPQNIVRVGDEALIKINLETGGCLEPFLFCDSEWCAVAKFEGWGIDDEFATNPEYLDLDPHGPNNYEMTIPIPSDVNPGTYKVVVVVRIRRRVEPHDPAPVVGFAELPYVQYYEGKS